MKNIFVIVMFSIILIGFFGCDTNEVPERTETKEKITVLGTVNMVSAYNGDFWISDINDSRFRLYNLLPNGVIANNTEYDITITGSSDTVIDQFQIVFSSINENGFNWVDLASPSEKILLQTGNFSISETFTTISNATTIFSNSFFAFTNDTNGNGDADDEVKAILTNVIIKIVVK